MDVKRAIDMLLIYKHLVELFYKIVHTINAKDYTKEQLNV